MMQRLARISSILIVLGVVAVVCFYQWWSFDETPAFSTHANVLAVNSALSAITTPKAVQPKLAAVQSTAGNILKEELQGTSLRDTDIDRSMVSIVDGQLVLNGGLLFYFDYFLTLEGEMPLAEIRLLLWRDVKANYSEAVAQQIGGLFDRYLGYLAEVRRREASVTSEQVIAEHLSARVMQDEVKQQFFSEAEIAALFEGYDAMLAKPSQASAQQKNYEHYQQAIKENPQQQESVATELFGAGAAQNLRNVQYQRQQWAGRVANYEREKQSVLASYPNDVEGQNQALALLQQRLFSETEMRHVEALERIAVSRQ